MGVESILMGAYSVGLGFADNAANGDKPPKGGGIPGLTSSVGGGKDGTEGSVVQVDPTTALDYFKKAATAQEEGFDKGLSYYGPALKKAGNEISTGFRQANQTLKPLSYSSNQALNEQMRMMGLDPIQATVGYGDALRMGIKQSGVLDPGQREYANAVATAMDNATNARDPAERKMYKANIQSMMDNAYRTFTLGQDTAYGKLLEAEQTPAAKASLRDRIIAGTQPSWDGNTAWADAMANDPNSAAAFSQADNVLAHERATKITNQKADIQTELGKSRTNLEALQAGVKDFLNSYSEEYDGGYNAQKVIEKISSTPGYGFQLDQGQKGLERKAAASGMVASANTQAALQEFGQNQAMSYYNNYLSQLGGIVAQGASATGQIAANQAAEGSALGQLAQLYGQAQMDNARQIASYQAENLMAQGNLFQDTAKFNAGLQFNSAENAKKAASAQALGAPAMMNAQTNAGQLGLAQAQFQQQLANSQSYGQAYLQGAGGGGGQGSYGSPQGNWNALSQYLSGGSGRYN